jgi:hypothetical protein
MEKKVVTFNLSENLEYSTGGDFSNTAQITLHAPSMECFNEGLTLSQLVTGSFMSAQSMATANDAEMPDNADAMKDIASPKADEIKIILMASQTVSITKIARAFRELACKVGYLDDKESERLKETHFKKMLYEDVVDMLCEYVANFIFPSLFKVEESR